MGNESDLNARAHRVKISKPFYMGIHQVTIAQWKAVMGFIPSNEKNDLVPATNVDWDDAVSFCQKLSDVDAERKAGRVYWLPTEAQWEYACRAGTQTKYSFGDDDNRRGDFAWFGGNSGELHPVGQKRPNSWGLCDMHGNVSEWCNDWYGSYDGQPDHDPVGSPIGKAKVVRGGLAAKRIGFPSVTRNKYIGLRVVVSLDKSPVVPPPDPAPRPLTPKEARDKQVDAAKKQKSNVMVTNSTGMQLVLIPAGEFTMGSREKSAGPSNPVHIVTISKAFLMGVHEVTNTQWNAVMGGVPSRWKDGQRPVQCVSWEEAVSFCRKLSDVEAERNGGLVYRLPTEAEWEYACRAGATSEYAFGNDAELLGEAAWFDSNSGKTTHVVGEKKPNAWGLFDMHGNVSEWCSDWFGGYDVQPQTDPKGAPTGGFRVHRGGSFSSPARGCQCASRMAEKSRWEGQDRSPYLSYGFRVVVSLE